MSWLLPVGTPGGITSGFEGIPDGSGIVKLADKLGCLDSDQYRLWRAAAAAPHAEDLIAWGTSKGIADAAGRVRQLEDTGLLVEEGPDVAERIGGLALCVIGECLGNGTQVSPVFLVRGRSGSPLQVDGFLFEVLLHCDGFSPLSVICDKLDASRSEPGYRPRIKTLTDGLPGLVRNEVVRLEAVIA
jgi:hypothetical protein